MICQRQVGFSFLGNPTCLWHIGLFQPQESGLRHQITTKELRAACCWCCISFDSYIKPQLCCRWVRTEDCCISFDSYIKPQQCGDCPQNVDVVYLLIPTSNHNVRVEGLLLRCVVYLLIPTSNHNSTSYLSVVKDVVYLLIPTSNHNCARCQECHETVVYLLIPTSNHN